MTLQQLFDQSFRLLGRLPRTADTNSPSELFVTLLQAAVRLLGRMSSPESATGETITAQQMIDSALLLIGRLATGESAGATESADCLRVMNQMLESWKNEGLPVDRIASLATTIGFPAGYHQAIRFNLALRLASEYGVQVPATVAEGAAGTLKELQVRANQLYTNMTYAYNQMVESWMNEGFTGLARYSATTDSMTLLYGYKEALAHALAVRMAPDLGLQVDQRIADKAMELKAQMRLRISPTYPEVLTVFVEMLKNWNRDGIRVPYEYSAASDTLSEEGGMAEAMRFNLAVLLAPELGMEAPASVVGRAAGMKNKLLNRYNDVPELVADPAIRRRRWVYVDSY